MSCIKTRIYIIYMLLLTCVSPILLYLLGGKHLQLFLIRQLLPIRPVLNARLVLRQAAADAEDTTQVPVHHGRGGAIPFLVPAWPPPPSWTPPRESRMGATPVRSLVKRRAAGCSAGARGPGDGVAAGARAAVSPRRRSIGGGQPAKQAPA